MKPTKEAIEAAALEIRENGPYYAGSKIRESMAKHLAEVALPAAYAAQFQSEEYAEIIEKLRDDYQKTVELCAEAADALEAVLVERKNLTAAVLLSERQNEILTGDMDRLRTERDALAARLAPVDDEALVEIVAYYFTDGSSWSALSERLRNICRRDARNAIAAIRPHIEAAERERCARIADDCDKSTHPADVAAAIRRGSGK